MNIIKIVKPLLFEFIKQRKNTFVNVIFMTTQCNSEEPKKDRVWIFSTSLGYFVRCFGQNMYI